MSSNPIKRVKTFVLATNSEGEPELLCFELAVLQSEYDDGAHYDAAKSKAEEEGYEPQGAFDEFDRAARQMASLAPVDEDEHSPGMRP